MLTAPIKGTSRKLNLNDYKELADKHNIPFHRLRAVAKVESAGGGWTRSGLIKALYEKHVAWRTASKKNRNRLRTLGLAYPKWRRDYARGTLAQHKKTVAAEQVELGVGIQAASWGMFQVLGENYRVCGFSSPKAFLEYQLKGEREQTETMIRFCKGNRILDELQRGQWAAFARRYNGPGYKKNRYDTKLRAAEDLYRRHPASGLSTDGNVVIEPSLPNAKPSDITKEAQSALNVFGFGPLVVDGKFGKKSSRALLNFQKKHPKLANDGKLGPMSLASLRKSVEYHKTGKKSINLNRLAAAGAGVAAGAGGVAAQVATPPTPADGGVPPVPATGTPGILVPGDANGAPVPPPVALVGVSVFWATLAIVALGAAVVAFFAWRSHKKTQEFDEERNHEINIEKGGDVEVAPWTNSHLGNLED